MMQTFLPYNCFVKSAQCLDRQRLGKQRLECKQILNALKLTGIITLGRKPGWVNHPATRMWRGYEEALALYMDEMIDEWVKRGYKNTMARNNIQHTPPMPPWLGRADFHASHRAALLYKAPEHYKQFAWTETPELNYVWPS